MTCRGRNCHSYCQKRASKATHSHLFRLAGKNRWGIVAIENFRRATQHQHRLYSCGEGGPIGFNEGSLQYPTLRLLVLASNFGAERPWQIKLNTASYNLAFDDALTC